MKQTANSVSRVLLASLVGTTIEFFDFYAFATAAVIVFPKLFFRADDPAAAMLQSMVTFSLAFFARPLGAVVFGHFGDRVGRKASLVVALLCMGCSTVLIGLLPTYVSIGVWAPVLLSLCRFGQGVGLGGEWGGAVLLANENASPGKRAWYGGFPQLGAPLGFLCSTAVFWVLSGHLSNAQFLAWGWRMPFLASAILVIVGLYVRLSLAETADFQRAIDNQERVRVPLFTLLAEHPRALVLGTLASTAAFVILYLMTVFMLSWGTANLNVTRTQFLLIQMLGMACTGLAVLIAAATADRCGPRTVLLAALVGLIAFGSSFRPLLDSAGFGGVLLFCCLGLTLAGLSYGPLGAALAELFPTPVRYSGISLTFNVAGILGASLTPYIATRLVTGHGLAWVGYYLSAVSLASAIALLLPAVRGRVRNSPVLA